MSQECLQVNTWLKNWFYDESEVDSLVNSKSVTVEKKGTADTGFLASYVVKQGGSQVGATINIPKDFLVKSGSVKTCSTANVPVQGYIVGDKYLDLVVNTKDGSGSDEHLYVLVSDLVDVPIDWSDIENKPSSFTPSSHNHTVSNITDFPTVPTKTSDLTNDSGYLTSHQDITGKEDKSNKVASWSSTVTDTNYPTEKLVKDSLDGKASSTDLTNGLQSIGGYTIHTVYNVGGTASAYDISSGLSYAQQTPIFFLVKNNIGDNQANATMKYYPNGNNITILDAFSSNSASPIQQGVWKKDTWGLFFCTNNSIVQLRCVFYDSVDIDEKLGDLSGDVTSLSSNITILDNIERISSTHSPSTSHWTGESQTLTSLENGTKILYRLTKTPTIDSKVAYLTLTLSNGNTTSEYSVLFKGATSTAIEFSHNSFVQNDVFLLEFKDNVWRVRDFFAIGYRPTVARTGSYNDLSDKPTIPTVPTNVSAFNNDSGYLTAHQDISGKEDKSNKVTSLSSSSTDTEYPSAKAVYDSLPSVPSASTTTPSADTTNGSVGTGTTWARSNHTHPKSSLYAEASHTHNQYLTSHQSIKTINNNSLIGTGNVDLSIPTSTSELANDGDSQGFLYLTTNDVINDLISNTDNSPLSAKQGKVLKGLVDGKASSTHNHSISDVTDLQTTLNGKANSSHTHSEYVNPTIIDNLTTNDATKVLSAKQGKVLNDLIGDAIQYINS